MSIDTRAENRTRRHLNPGASHWVFGYGSLIFKVDFPFLESRPASIQNWARRFWQGSHDHRGTEEKPGRVVTLIEAPGAVCAGMAFKIDAAVFSQLDMREKNGYLCFSTELTFDDNSHADGLVYIATADNGAFLGEADEKTIADEIALAHGASGSNREYLLKLANALRELGIHDEHVFTIEGYLLST